MIKMPIPVALKELASRNGQLTAAYRDWARRLPPGPASRLASSMAEQRLDLGEALGELLAKSAMPSAEVEFESAPASTAGHDAHAVSALEPKALLKRMVDAEAAECELLAAAAGAILPSSSDAAELLAAQAASARKRSLWAQDQLDLLSL
jgi:hypothetical protein